MTKRISSTALFALILWGCTAVNGVLHAQKNDADTLKAQDAGGQTLDNNSLKTVLDNMGLEPQKLTHGYLLSVKQDTWTINIQIVLSSDMRKIGLNSNLGKVEAPDSITAAQWRDLLVSNGNIDPSSFYLDTDQKKLYLHRSFDNRAVTPSILRREIENFTGNVKNTGDLWKFTK